ncbi:helix-turn-helix domain-containing protein [Parabacteroides sp.]
MDAQEVCLALGISKRCLQAYRDRGLVPYSHIGGKYFYRETDIQQILEEGLIKNRK